MAVPGNEEPRELEIEVTYVEMLDPGQLNPAPETDLVVTRAELPLPELNRFLYAAVGAPWRWTHRRSWSYETWRAYVERPELHTWVGYLRGTPVGYFELEQQDADIEVRSLGLVSRVLGRGLGGDLLTRAVRIAWSMNAQRLWLHTCTLDSPMALNNYLSRGFRVFQTECVREIHAMDPPGPW